MQLKPYQIVENKQIAPGSWLLSVHRDFDFEPGQVVSLTIAKESIPRMYSVCSSNRDPLLKILYSLRPNGELTPQLCDLNIGDSVLISPPSGQFRATSQKACFIAAGTGIAPFYSMLQSGNKADKTLIHGARTEAGFYFSEALLAQLGKQYIRCCSGNAPSGTFAGRVTEYLKQATDLLSDQMFYLCGSAEMVVETRDILIRSGVLFRNIVAEIYF